ncbi:MAG TPA: hypothetical protein VGC13_00440 [Longimicrobium sp.]|jgi:hypothetical protein|uniref:hypothetical protein n=1 Tax=Longimicrobium sp. TaxID=2029185 RepID=UPI002EDB7F38
MNSPVSELNPEAVRFVGDLVTSVALLRGYATVLDTVAASTDKDTTPIDDFLRASGYKATVDEVAAAEAMVEANQIAYWCGVYSTQFVDQQGTRTSGPLLTISPQASGPVRIGYGNQWLIAPVFSGGQLVWLKADNDGTPVNDTAGSLLFSLTSLKSGGATRAFTGTLTQADGTQTQIVGVQSDITPPPGSTPPGQDQDLLKTAVMLVTAAVGVVGLTTVISNYRKAPLEREKLQLEIDQMRRKGNEAGAVRAEAQLRDGEARMDQAGRDVEVLNRSVQTEVSNVDPRANLVVEKNEQGDVQPGGLIVPRAGQKEGEQARENLADLLALRKKEVPETREAALDDQKEPEESVGNSEVKLGEEEL